MNDLLSSIFAELKGAWRFRWLAVISAWLACIAGWLFVYSIPDRYESKATVYVDTSSALRSLLNNLTVNSDVMSRVELVTTAWLGRPQLEKVARETDMHLRANSSAEMDKLILEMRDRINIEHDPRRDPSLYSIGYQDVSPFVAQSVVSTMLNNFVEDALGANRQDTQNAQEFLRNQLAVLESDLSASEQRLAEFKKENVGRMPSEGGGYFDRLQAEMDALERTRSSLRLAERRRATLQRQLMGSSPTIDSVNGVQSPVDVRISETESRLEELRLRFTDLHPDVIALTATLEQLMEQKRQSQLNALDSDSTSIVSDNPVFQNIQIELSNINVEIAALVENEATHTRKVSEYEDLVDVLPEVEAELSRLNRDYDVKLAQYQSLLERLKVAELSESAELSEDIKFRIIDPPFLPTDPVFPNRPLFLAAVLVVGLALGAGVAFLGNQLKPVFSDVRMLGKIAHRPVLGSIRTLRTPANLKRRRREVFAFVTMMFALSMLFVAALLYRETGSSIVHELMLNHLM